MMSSTATVAPTAVQPCNAPKSTLIPFGKPMPKPTPLGVFGTNPKTTAAKAVDSITRQPSVKSAATKRLKLRARVKPGDRDGVNVDVSLMAGTF